MAWNDNRGGGGRNNGGPWGQAPGGGNSGGGGGGGPRRPGGPNLEDILNRGRDSFSGGVPGGRWGIVAVVLAVIVVWVFQSVYTVDPQQRGVELLFGQPKDELSDPGLHFVFWPVETVELVDTAENQTRIGSVRSSRGTSSGEGLMLSGDQNIVDVAFSVLWRVGDPASYLFNVREPDTMVTRAAESAMREVVGRRLAQDIFRTDRAGIEIEVQDITQSILDSYGAGISIAQIAIEDVAPPAEVADAFDEVQRAEQDEDRFQEEARQYANTQLGQARGEAAQVREDAAAYKDRVVKEAEGEASRFIAVYQEYARAPEVTRKRIFLETLEEVLGNSEKVIIESGAGGGVVPYLPLPEVQSRNNARTGG
ncbi:FtsH protease activity modulator HflK [Cucumibacter marinus]|uniref:FtsH protease activity modulator HflK n=1 Tax=Cucumibacter marinus TaxID=1121252 RepID=UPI00048F9709|nr:FtsH protease activity modulator HflK [Cucumibacter marinus]